MQIDAGIRRAFQRSRRTPWKIPFVGISVVAVAFLIFGAIGVGHYVETFWLYRGFPAPSKPTFVTIGTGSDRHRVRVTAGVVQTVTVTSPALGGRSVNSIVYLPPGYGKNVHLHYPVLYLLHGFPGSPAQFVNVGDVATTSDVLIAEHRIQPMILVMPSGSTNFFVDNEWANSVRPHNDWETYVARDLVNFIDHRYLADTKGSERGLGGLSEGAYASLNIGFHHVGEFGLLESWSGYFNADSPKLFGDKKQLMLYNSPSYEVHRVADALIADRTFIWIFSGTRDDTKYPSKRFNVELTELHIPHGYAIHYGRHTWALWRAMMPQSLTIASRYFAGNHVPA